MNMEIYKLKRFDTPERIIEFLNAHPEYTMISVVADNSLVLFYSEYPKYTIYPSNQPEVDEWYKAPTPTTPKSGYTWTC